MKPKSDYAFVISCNPAYGFGLISNMNAQNYFKTDADWEIAYGLYSDEERAAISNSFPRNVTWTPIDDLYNSMVVDKRTIDKSPLERYWLAYWLLAHKLLKEKKYKAVCVIQADEFVFSNMDAYFKIAEYGTVVTSEYAFGAVKAEELPFGDENAIWDRCQFGIFDAVNFIGQKWTQLPMDIVHFQEEDAFRGEASHSVVALNRAVLRHCRRGDVLGLDGRLWCCDSVWPYTKLHAVGDKVYNSLWVRLYGWHARWWQKGRALSEWRASKEALLSSNNKDTIMWLDNCEHNFNFVRDFMMRFNNMIPEIRSTFDVVEGPIRRIRYEQGEIDDR